MIVHHGGLWHVRSEDGTKNLGTYNSKEEAEKRLKEVEYFKNTDKTKKEGK